MSKQKADTAEEVPTIRYLVKQQRDEFVIEVPETTKVTFSSVNPASQGSRHDGYCVRVYDMPGSKLRAVFADCIGLRDLGIPLARKIQSETGSAKWSKDSAGNFEHEEKREVNAQFILEPGADSSPF